MTPTRTLITVLFLALTLPGKLHAAFAATTAWDVRTTGATDNGGGFNTAASGTDRSQSDAAYITYADLVIGGTTTQATSAAFPFDATSPGNIVNVTGGAGCTVQRAQIVSVAGAVATFDKSLGTAASTCAGKLGGGLTLISAAVGLAVSTNSVHVKNGTYTLTSAVAVGSGIWLQFFGYSTTHNDGGTKPVVTTATSSMNMFQLTNNRTSFTNMTFTNTAATRWAAIALQDGNAATLIDGCLFDGNGNALYSGATTLPSYVVNSEMKNGTSVAIYTTGRISLYGAYIHNNTGNGVETTSTDNSIATLSITRSIVTNNTDGVVATTNAHVVVNESVIANNSSDGINLTSPSTLQITNTVVYGNGAYGITATVAPWFLAQYNNAFGANVSGNRNNVATATSDVTLTANPFTNAGAGDYALNSTAGGGAAAKAAGFPGVFPGGTTTGYLDVGAVQTASGAAAATIAYPMVQ